MSNIVYETLIRYAPFERKSTPGGWISFNGPCCIYNGEARPDTRKRGGVMLTPENACVYHCFNCKFKAVWSPGRTLNGKFRSLFSWMGVPEDEIKKVNFKIWQLKESTAKDNVPREISRLVFKESSLPKDAMPITFWLEQNLKCANFYEVLSYLSNRGEDILTGYDYYWTPDTSEGLNRRFIIPFRWNGKIVGWTARAVYPTRHRYYSNVPPNYLFNTDVVKDNWEYLLLSEGPLDAIANKGVATLGDKISPQQIQWLNETGKKIVVVPDREKQGGTLVDVAIREGWYVSFPKWDSDIKDSAAAVKRYGQLYTIWTIIDAKTDNRLQISIERQRLR